ncbi:MULTISPECIES: lytic polysaccharide monooxygenase auxiliary activity family 9 protein [unclassified Solwaraspora]|uniref:lytic polysaccharide monooxygenase auxiliary activity family 9 protein n=1 Tax=unclassified Solwaraspora TaxID=2627926 RepID=UPI00259B2ACF|nr:lytic polysaccharide monooxygenase [Solwaraspora sp. WMMA2056]WJK39741.1 lytic polysaccharide monooxygenase [Solwaraspora sp. WMMA2056]
MRLLTSDRSDGPTRTPARKSLRVLVLVSALMVAMLPWTGAAQAHGTIINPASRAYQCWKSWGNQHTNPAMQQQDPMCYRAFQANPDTMWNWMSALRDGLGGQYQARTPDGQLCSNALSRNDSLNQPGAWRTTTVGRNFTVQLYDQASHGADYFRAYVTKQGFNPATQRVGWGNLDLIATTGRYAPSQNISFNVSVPSGRSGNHVLFVIWKASHMDQAYMWCSDINIV